MFTFKGSLLISDDYSYMLDLKDKKVAIYKVEDVYNEAISRWEARSGFDSE